MCSVCKNTAFVPYNIGCIQHSLNEFSTALICMMFQDKQLKIIALTLKRIKYKTKIMR